jgi:hypothetical protein
LQLQIRRKLFNAVLYAEEILLNSGHDEPDPLPAPKMWLLIIMVPSFHCFWGLGKWSSREQTELFFMVHIHTVLIKPDVHDR